MLARYTHLFLFILTAYSSMVFSQNHSQTLSDEETISKATLFYESKKTKQSLKLLNNLLETSKKLDCIKKSRLLMAQIYMDKGSYEEANDQLNAYLNRATASPDTVKVWEMKFKVAEHFSQGGRRHLFSCKKLPKWIQGRTFALELYDEIIDHSLVPDLIRNSYLGAARSLALARKYEMSNQKLLKLIHSYPKTQESFDAFVELSYNYLCKMQDHSRDDKDLLLAQSNMEKFQIMHADDSKIYLDSYALMQNRYFQMENLMVYALMERAELYTKRGKPQAAKAHYLKIVNDYSHLPHSKFAKNILGLPSEEEKK